MKEGRWCKCGCCSRCGFCGNAAIFRKKKGANLKTKYDLVVSYLKGEFGWNKFHQTRMEVPVVINDMAQMGGFDFAVVCVGC